MNGELRRKVKQERIFMAKPEARDVKAPEKSVSIAPLLPELRIFQEGSRSILVVPALAKDNSLDTIIKR